MMKQRSILIVCLLFFTLLSVGCGTKDAPQSNSTPQDPSIVTVKEEFLPRLKIAPVSEGDSVATLRVPARIELDEQRLARIGAAVTGRVTQIFANLGQRVARGEQLATIHSTELAAAQLAYLKALSQSELQNRAVERSRLLYASDVIGAAEVQKRENELAQARAEMQAAHGQLSVLGMTENAIKKIASSRTAYSFSSITSTQSGVVIERKVAPGQVVQPAGPLFTVADLSHVWVVAEIPEQQSGMVRNGELAQAEIPALNGKRIAGRLIYVADTVNPDSRTVTVRMDAANPDRLLKPAMLASMLIQGPPQRRLLIPSVAVVRENNIDHVFVQLDGYRFQLRPVSLGEKSNGSFSVQSGLRKGEIIVIEGAFHLNNERKRKELEG